MLKEQTGVARSLEFSSLPLVESALRTSFQVPVPVSFATLNGVRSALAAEFKALDDLPQVEAAPGVNATFSFGVGQVTGAVLSGHDLGVRVSIQPNVVVTRWVREFHSSAPKYPGYSTLEGVHKRALRAFLDFAAGSDAQFGAVNMSYTNFLQLDGSAETLRRYFSKDAHVGLVSDAPSLHKIEVAWKGHDDVDLRFRLEKVGIQWGNERRDGFGLTTVAGSAVASGSDAESKLALAHARLQTFFEGLISDHAKKEWGYREPSNS